MDNQIKIPVVVTILVFVAIRLYSNKLRFLHVIPRSKWLSIAGGSSIAYVFIILLPELSNFQRTLEVKQVYGVYKPPYLFCCTFGIGYVL